MRKRIIWFILGLFLTAGVWIGTPLAADKSAAVPVSLEVYNPTGAIQVNYLFAPRLADLNGKTICEVSNGGWEANRTFPAIREALKVKFPTAKIISYAEFPVGTYEIDVDNIGDLLKKKGCQAAIVGNAG
jgi:hypothetical protein